MGALSFAPPRLKMQQLLLIHEAKQAVGAVTWENEGRRI